MGNRDTLKKLFAAAKKAQARAHAPYSKHKVGAAILTKKNEIISGCNIENASYGGTVCAERVAIWKGVSEGLKGPIAEICVYSDQPTPWPPCGMCRQVIAEFATKKTLIHLANKNGIQQTYTFEELFPHSFNSTYL